MQATIKTQFYKLLSDTIPSGWQKWREAAETFREPLDEKLPSSRSTSHGILDLDALDTDLQRWRNWYRHRGYAVIGSLVTITQSPKQANVEIYLETEGGKLYKRTVALNFDQLSTTSQEIQNELNANKFVKLEQVFDGDSN